MSLSLTSLSYKNKRNMSKEQIETMLESERNIKFYINLADVLRKNKMAGSMDYFETIFLEAKKFL